VIGTIAATAIAGIGRPWPAVAGPRPPANAALGSCGEAWRRDRVRDAFRLELPSPFSPGEHAGDRGRAALKSPLFGVDGDDDDLPLLVGRL